MSKKILLSLLVLCLAFNADAQKFSVGVGFNRQYHRMRYMTEDLPHKEVNKQLVISPTLYLGCKLNKKFYLAFDLTYLKYNRSIETNINFNHPDDTTASITTLNYEKTPMLCGKINYKLYKNKKDVKFFVSTGFALAYQKRNDAYNGTVTTRDSGITGTDYNLRPSYLQIHYLLGLQVNLPLSDMMSINFSVNNVFGGKNYLFKQQYTLHDAANTRKQLEYGLFGGFAYFDFKLVYNFTNKKKKAEAKKPEMEKNVAP